MGITQTSKSALTEAIDAAVADRIQEFEANIEKETEHQITEWLEKHLVEYVNRAVLQMLATPAGGRKAGSKRAPGHKHRGICGPKCFSGERDADGNIKDDEEAE